MLVSPKILQFFNLIIFELGNFLNAFSKYISGQDPVKPVLNRVNRVEVAVTAT